MRTFATKIAGLTQFILCVVLATLAFADDQQEEMWGPVKEGCRFQVSSNRGTYSIGQAVRLQLVLKNVSENTIKMFDYPTSIFADPHYRMDFRDSNNNTVKFTSRGEKLALRGFGGLSAYELEPGKVEVVKEDELNEFYDLQTSGEYTLTVYRRLWYTNKAWVEVPSNTIKIKIHD